jgi:hypothetical protein
MDVKMSTSIVNSGQSKENVRKIQTTWSALPNMQAVAAKAARSVEDTNTLSLLYKDRMNAVQGLVFSETVMVYKGVVPTIPICLFEAMQLLWVCYLSGCIAAGPMIEIAATILLLIDVTWFCKPT